MALVAASPSRGERAISSAHAPALAVSVGGATTRFTRPMRNASLARMVRPVRSRSRA